MKDFTEYILEGATVTDLRQIMVTATPYVAPPTVPASNGDKPKNEAKNGTAPVRPVRKSIAERIIDLADVAAPSDLPLLFGPYLLKGSAHWLTGKTGLGKSTLLFNIACALAEGTSLWGIECKPTRILYCDMESGDVGRAYKIERLYRDRRRVRGQLLFLREPIKLPEELTDLLTYVQEQGIGLVIFDTARRVFSVHDENDNAEVYNKIVPTLDALKLAGVSSLTLGHPSKNGDGSARGAGAQEDAGDVNLSLTVYRGEATDKDAVIELRVTKNRLLGLCIPPLRLRRIGDDQFELHDGGDSEQTKEPIGKTLQCQQFLRMALEGSNIPLKHGMLWKLAEEGGHTRTTFNRGLKELKSDNDIVETDGGYSIDPFAD